MSRRETLLNLMRSTPGAIRFTQVQALLRYEGFHVVNTRGSHFTDQHGDGRLLLVVRPHGNRKTCDPRDIRKTLKALGW